MRYIKKYNENNGYNEVDEEYLISCFSDFIDFGKVIEYEKSWLHTISRWHIEIFAKDRTLHNFDAAEISIIDKMVNDIKDEEEFYLDIKESIKRVGIEYDYFSTIDKKKNSIVINFYNTKNKLIIRELLKRNLDLPF